ncbi:HipA N-terminal domain-containing protein [Paenarthrobacter sp. NPDC089675]|uniref:HipA N-terminal domain-containing protein n=1 Tax=Paenarthrobacter sp. NPDC089675 TaxID=3364376 RepID=UPI0037F6344F
MAEDLAHLKFVRTADVYKSGMLAGHLERTEPGSVLFTYAPGYAASGANPIASTLTFAHDPVESPNGALPALLARGPGISFAHRRWVRDRSAGTRTRRHARRGATYSENSGQQWRLSICRRLQETLIVRLTLFRRL